MLNLTANFLELIFYPFRNTFGLKKSVLLNGSQNFWIFFSNPYTKYLEFENRDYRNNKRKIGKRRESAVDVKDFAPMEMHKDRATNLRPPPL